MPRIRSLASGFKTTGMVAGIAGVVVVLVVVLGVAILPPRITVSPGDGETEIKPTGQFLEVGTSHWGASLSTVLVKEARVAPDGTRENERVLDGQLQNGRFVLSDGSSPLVEDAEYKVTVAGTVKEIGLSGITDTHVDRTYTFTTVTTPMPIIPVGGVKVRYGEEATIEWNIPVGGTEYQLDGIGNTMRMEDGGRVMKISLAKFEQGKEYPLRITAATSLNGRELKAPIVTNVATAAPLKVAFDPIDGTSGASIDVHPIIAFSEPVSNLDLAKTAITIEPKVEGKLNWVEPGRLEFVPTATWDHLQDVTITVKGGPTQLRGISGGYMETEVRSTFTTAPYKSIDVNITEQRVTLYEDGKQVDTFLCSTGNSGTDTPLGDYTIYAKLSSVDMRGPGYFAPKVPWVMVFKGDYTMHGNYWATSFGARSSHGCVGLPVETAKRVYDWTPTGTPIHIHE
ncbi:MAG: L,D-transpeptidase family protein [Thermoleophilia bacterium]